MFGQRLIPIPNPITPSTARATRSVANCTRPGPRFIALADGNNPPVVIDWASLSRRRLRLGVERPEHDRPLHGEPTRHEHLGGAPGTDPDFAMGRPATEFTIPAVAYRLQAHQTDGSGTGRSRSRSGGHAIAGQSTTDCSVKRKSPPGRRALLFKTKPP